MMEPHMIEHYIYCVFVIVVNHVGFILYFFLISEFLYNCFGNAYKSYP